MKKELIMPEAIVVEFNDVESGVVATVAIEEYGCDVIA